MYLFFQNSFCQAHQVIAPYVAGSMYRGISSVALVVAMARAQLLSFLGAAGLSMTEIEAALQQIKAQLPQHAVFGANVLFELHDSAREWRLLECYLAHQIQIVEASAYLKITPALVRYRLTDICQLENGDIVTPYRIIAKVSRLEIASLFMQPPPATIVAELLASGKISETAARLAPYIPMAQDITVEADSAGHTDQGVLTVIFPAIYSLARQFTRQYGYQQPLRVGAAGGLGTPLAIVAAWAMGADYVLTGSINQCTVESGASDAVKDLLQTAGLNDTTYVPAGDMFELGAKVQVFKRGLLFPQRANKLYELYQHYDSINAMDSELQHMLQETYFKRSFAVIWQEIVDYFTALDPAILERAYRYPKYQMALIFRWYFGYTTRIALVGDLRDKLNFQIHSGPALGAFNLWVKDTELAPWHNRRIALISQKILAEASLLLEAFAPILQRS